LDAKTAAIKLVMDIESRRIDMLQKAGLLENKELAEEMVEIERRQEVLMAFLEILHLSIQRFVMIIMQRLSAIAREGEVITVVHDVQ
jgi:hypothetical protein